MGIHRANLLHGLLTEFGIERRSRKFVDLTVHPSDVTFKLCYRLVLSGEVVLHGSNSSEPFSRLQPHQANDAAKASGNETAVYASVNVAVALMQAVLDKRHIRSMFPSFVIGYRVVEGVTFLKVTDNVYRLFVEHEDRVCSDGYIYVLDRTQFREAANSNSEFFCPSSIVPQCVLKVSATLRLWLFSVGNADRPDTVLPYSAEEQQRLTQHQSWLERAAPNATTSSVSSA